MAASRPSVRYAVADLVTVYEGQKVVLERGEAWWSDDPFVKLRPDLFSDEPTKVRGQRPVEQATKNPGQKRAARRA